MKSKSIKIGIVVIGVVIVCWFIYRYNYNQVIIRELQGNWYATAVEVNDGKVLPLSDSEFEIELTAEGEYLINQQKEFDYRFNQRYGRLYLQLYQRDNEDETAVDFDYAIKKHGASYTFTRNDMILLGKRVATGMQLTKKPQTSD